jgi:very-short-patch-repair endonuclease
VAQRKGESLIIDKAKYLRTTLTDAERKIWQVVRAKRFGKSKFKRQERIGFYIVDFVCYQKKIIIEIDGKQHLDNVEYDSQRTKWLEEQGFRVLRFWNDDILSNIEVVKKVIFRLLSPLVGESQREGKAE